MFLSKANIELIEKDINAVNDYKFFSNKEEGTIEVSITIDVPEEFIVSEEALAEIVMGLLPALDEKAIAIKIEQVKTHLRMLGASQ
jgi:hypothetical protein